ncbi:class I SAM-dependent methyltransferase [Rhodomicrobium udaipurense]|uniref:SAM-dependent methyltransferase n=1 Tax=Rhodomicrobium udaipurense TaxID=1202716 RepID=A0A8I1GFJ7_9HYPH|nr:SAM-dependent methyltransferase [Rhodomicrobium udaipurense]MBJ7543884.1 SAM-dependent methyltransferase [Rhodomicrobium udaipurense]
MPSDASDSSLTPLALKLRRDIAERGPIPLHDYMEACLYDLQHGYYRKRDPLGRGGDFITAPEISQVFGELVGLWAVQVWMQMGQPQSVRLVELGPGRGTLMADALRAARVMPGFLQSIAVHLVESSEVLREAQKATLAGVPVPLHWHGDMGEVPSGPAIVIANEFLDCLPVRQFAFDGAGKVWRERVVAFENGAFRLAAAADVVQPPLTAASYGEPRDGDILEHCPGVGPLLAKFAARAVDAPLAALVIDYGYAKPAFGETLQAVRRHKFAGLFDAPGETDLTAHVDFSRLARLAEEAGFVVFGPMAMGEWLLRLGVEARANQLLASASAEEARAIAQSIARLVDPAQMGALFKILSWTRGISEPPPPYGEHVKGG